MGLYAASAAAALLLFVGGPDYYSPRAWRLAWDLGHLLAFFLWTAVSLSASARLAAQRAGRQILIIAPIALLLGLGIEWAQSLLGRTFSLLDVANDLLGSAAAMVFLSPRRLQMRSAALRSAQVVVLTLVALQALPLARVVIDDGIAWKQFPVLSDFETPFELSRWTSRSSISTDHGIARQGRASLRVPLTTQQYSGASLQHFPSRWEGYAALHLSIYNESENPLAISISIHDEKHMQSGRAYPDRFTAHFFLQRGWNDIDIPLEQIRNAPAHRMLDLESVRDLSVVAIALPAPRVIHIDDVRLTR